MTEREPMAEIPETAQQVTPVDPVAAVEPGPEEPDAGAQQAPLPEVNFAEYYHEARPRTLRHRARVRSTVRRRSVSQDGPASGENPVYVAWLLAQSMLGHADELARQFSGQGSMWQNPFASPGPRHAVETASVWFTAYPISLITAEGTEQAQFSVPGLTSIAQPVQRIAVGALEVLLKASGPAALHRMSDQQFSLVTRGSCGCPDPDCC